MAYKRIVLSIPLFLGHHQDCGRLVYAGQDDWVHINCALWSAEVYEEVDGTLQHVHTAIARGKQMVRTWITFYGPLSKKTPLLRDQIMQMYYM